MAEKPTMAIEKCQRPKRIRIDLAARLSRSGHFMLALASVVTVSLAAWWVGRDTETPAWISEGQWFVTQSAKSLSFHR